MYKTPFEENLDIFLYGKTCQQEHVNIRGDKKAKSNLYASKIGVSDLIAYAALVVTVAIVTVTAGQSFKLYDGGGGVAFKNIAPPESVFKQDDFNLEEIRNKITKNRNFLGLTQQELAQLLYVNVSTINKIENLEVLHQPEAVNLSKYVVFFQMTDYLKEKFDAKKYAIRMLLNEKLSAFGYKNAIEYSHKVGDEGIFEVYAVYKRIYG